MAEVKSKTGYVCGCDGNVFQANCYPNTGLGNFTAPYEPQKPFKEGDNSDISTKRWVFSPIIFLLSFIHIYIIIDLVIFYGYIFK